ncbi:incF plasmid conjugative transfer pilus assembly protein traH [Vibrio sp. JCM 19236]|nr:incF plasmid conjugative transfer pilus assembly protein traH [Vibrio sp. JCM 19236]
MQMSKLNLITALLLSSVAPTALASSINDKMDDAFNALMNTTDPASYDTARRGVLSGGQIYIKVPTKRANLVSATAPSIQAGCGGIDVYGGSFSYLNKDQFVQTFQAVGANALGYGVKLAIQSACPSCEQIMTSLEKTMQGINKMNIDSCNMAEGLVNASADFATGKQADASAKALGVNTGVMEDISEAWSWVGTEGSSASNKVKSTNPNEYKTQITGNVAWRAFKNGDIESVYSADNDFLELMMTITGSVVISDTSTDPDAVPSTKVFKGHGIKLADLVNGGDYLVYDCDTNDVDGCLNPPMQPNKTITDTGLHNRVYDALKDMDTALTQDQEWTDQAKRTLGVTTLVGNKCMQKIYQASLANSGTGIRLQLINMCASRMALDTAMTQVLNYIDAAESAVLNSENDTSLQSAKQLANDTFEESRKSYIEEYTRLSNQMPIESIITTLDSLDFSDGQRKDTQGK